MVHCGWHFFNNYDRLCTFETGLNVIAAKFESSVDWTVLFAMVVDWVFISCGGV